MEKVVVVMLCGLVILFFLLVVFDLVMGFFFLNVGGILSVFIGGVVLRIFFGFFVFVIRVFVRLILNLIFVFNLRKSIFSV